MTENWGDWSALGRGLRKRFWPTEEDKLEREASKLAIAKETAEMKFIEEQMAAFKEKMAAAQEERAMLKKPIYEEPSAYRTSEGGGYGTIEPGYKSPVTWGSLARLKGAGLEPQLSERDIKGLGVEGVSRIHEPTYRPRYRVYRTPEGNYVELPEGSGIPKGYIPVGVTPEQLEQFWEFGIEQEKEEEKRRKVAEKKPFPGVFPLIQQLFTGKRAFAEQGAMENLPDPAEYKGKTARDTTTGKRYRSDGMQWIEIE